MYHCGGCRLKQIRICANVCPHRASRTAMSLLHGLKQLSTMILQTLAFFALIATCVTLSIPTMSSILQLPSRNQTILSPLTNATGNRLGVWPDAPFTRHLDWDTYIEIIKRTPSSPSDPTPEMGVLEGISVIDARVRAHSQLALIQDYQETEGPVTFRFHAMDDLFKGREIAQLLDQLWEMTNLYGKSQVYGRLVRVEEITAYFEILLQRP